MEGEKSFYISSKMRARENVILLLNEHKPWSQSIWERLRYSVFCLGKEVKTCLQESEAPGVKCRARKTFSQQRLISLRNTN